MNREQILTSIKKYFSIKELVCNHTYQKWGERAWQFLDTDFLHALLIIREEILKMPMTCNSSDAMQRGLRCNMCELVKSKSSVYLSSHIFGKAADFTVEMMSAEDARIKIKQYAHLLPCNIRIEGGVSWLHIDVLPQMGVTQRVYEFRA